MVARAGAAAILLALGLLCCTGAGADPANTIVVDAADVVVAGVKDEMNGAGCGMSSSSACAPRPAAPRCLSWA